MDRGQHQLLYREKYGVDEFDLDSELAPIPISPSMSEAEVYRMLPTATDFEHGGFNTDSFIRYEKCDATSASTGGKSKLTGTLSRFIEAQDC
jgi:hypothetical protein